MVRRILSFASIGTLVLFSACSGSGSAPVPNTSNPDQTGTAGSAPPPASYHISEIASPQAPSGSIVVAANGSIYMDALSELMRYNGAFAQYPYPSTASLSYGSVPGPVSLAVGPNSTVWAIQQAGSSGFGSDGAFAALNTTGGTITETQEDATAPNGGFFSAIAAAPNDMMWLAHVHVNTGQISGYADIYNSSYALSGQYSGAGCTSPCTYYGPFNAMTLGSDGKMYVATTPGVSSFSGDPPHPSVIYRVDPATQSTLSMTALPSGSSVTQIAAGPDNAVWFTDTGLNEIGRLSSTGTLTYYSVPTANSGLSGIAPGSDNAMWFTEKNANKIGRIATDGTITEYAINDPNAHPQGITAGPLGGCVPHTMYFTVTSGLGTLTFS